MLLIKRHYKLWLKFFANLSFRQISYQRCWIKIFKMAWFLLAWPFELLGDLLIRLPTIKQLPDNPKILFVKIDQLGDVLFSTFLLPIIKDKYPASQIDYLINRRSSAVLQNNPLIHRVYYWQDLVLQNIPGRQRFSLIQGISRTVYSWLDNLLCWRQLARQKYDLIINVRAFWPSSNWPWFWLRSKLVAFDLSQASCLTNYRADYNLRAEEWQNYLNLLQPLDINLNDLKQPYFPQHFFNFSPLSQTIESPYWCLSPVSFDPEKTWSSADWIEFIKYFLVAGPRNRLVLIGLPNHKDWLKPIMDNFSSQPRVTCFTNLSIPQLAELLKNSQGLIGIDSFAAHLAIALGRPVSCLVNSRLFYVSGLSRSSLIDGRSMLPRLPLVIIKDLLTTKPEQLIKAIFK